MGRKGRRIPLKPWSIFLQRAPVPRGSEPRSGLLPQDTEAPCISGTRPRAPPRRRYKARVPFHTSTPAATGSPMAGPAMLVAATLWRCAYCWRPRPPRGTSRRRDPGYYSAWAAPRLLSRFHRSPYARRSGPRGGTRSLGGAGTFRRCTPTCRSLVSNGRCWVQALEGAGAPLIHPHLSPQAVCVEEVTPNLQAHRATPPMARATFSARLTSSCRSAPRTVQPK